MKDKRAMSRAYSFTRRGILIGAGACAAGALCANSALANKMQPLPLSQYKPVFFTQQEWAFIMAATARLIPSDGDGPGALEARVPVFIDRQMLSSWGQGLDWYRGAPFDRDAPSYNGYQAEPTPAEAYRYGIGQINQWCEQTYGKTFANLTASQQDEVLTALEQDAVPIKELRSSDFFTFLLQNTKEGYLADPKYGGNFDMAAWVYIGFPGARGAFLEWVEKDNIPYRLGPVSLQGERA